MAEEPLTLTPQAMHNAVISVVLAYAGALADKERQIQGLVKALEVAEAGAEVWRKKHDERGKHNDELGKLARERGEELEQAKREVDMLGKELENSRRVLTRKSNILSLVAQGVNFQTAMEQVSHQEKIQAPEQGEVSF